MNKVILRKKRKAHKTTLIMCAAIILLQIIIILCLCTIHAEQKELANVEPIIKYRTVYIKEIPHGNQTDNRTETEATTEEGSAPTAPVYTEMTVTATAYCACTYCTDGDGITATGTQATAGRTIAVDPSIIPYGTEVIINGNTYIAEDCGAAIKGNKVDIYFDTHAEALQFGRQTLTAYIS